MPNKIVQDLIDAVKVLQTDVQWIKRSFWALVALGTMLTGVIVKFILTHVVWH